MQNLQATFMVTERRNFETFRDNSFQFVSVRSQDYSIAPSKMIDK